MTVIVTKNSSTASAVPLTSDLVQGELAVNVTDKRIFTENASTAIVELGTNPSTLTTTTATVTGVLTANGTLASSNAVITGGSVNSTPIGATTPSTIVGSTVTASTGFVGGLTGDVTGNITGNVTGNITGGITGDVTGNVTAATGTTTLNDLVVNGTVDFTDTKLTNLATPTADTDAATKGYVDTAVSDVINAAPAALDTLNELADALGDDANFATTVTDSIALKLPLAGGTMSGAIAMGTSKITGLGDPTGTQDAATKTYVDTADALKLDVAGGTMSGAIAMGTNKITGLGTPTVNTDATTKLYVDTILGSATVAATSAANAATSESNASTSASNAATSETNAAASESAASGSAAAAATSETNAAASETAAGTSETNAAASETAAGTSETNAAASESAAGTSETNAGTSETNAAASASAASTSASGAATSETNAATSETNAATSETNAAASYDSFDDRYLGQKASAPTLDNDGDALLTGALYFNTTSAKMQVYTGSAWTDVAPVATSVTVSQISDVTASATEINYIDGVTSSIQDQLNAKGVGSVTSVGGTGTVNGISLSGTVTSSGNLTLGGALTGVDLTSQVTGTLPVANGGTGATTLTANNVLLGNGTSAPQAVAPSTAGNVLTSNGSTWQSTAPAGGGLSVDFVASGAIGNGVTVALKTDGTVEAITETTLNPTVPVGSTQNFETAASEYYAIAADPNNTNRWAIVYTDDIGNKYVYLKIITRSGTALTLSSASAITADTSSVPVVAWDGQTSGTLLVCYNESGRKAKVCTVSGSAGSETFTYGSELNIGSNNFNLGKNSPKLSSLGTTGNYLLTYDRQASGYMYGIVLSVSGTAVTKGTETVITSRSLAGLTLTSHAVDVTDSTKALAVWIDLAANDYIYAASLTISGTSISIAGGSSISGTTRYSTTIGLSATFGDSSGKYVVAGRDRTDNDGYAFVVTDSGGSYSSGTRVAFLVGTISNAALSNNALTPNKFVVASTGVIATPFNAYINIGTISGTNITFNTASLIDSTNNTQKFLEVSQQNDSLGHYMTVYRPSSTTAGYATMGYVGGTSTNSADFIGITDAAISDTATGSVTVKGGVSTSVSSLTIGSDYYVQANGTLATTVSTVPAGRALSTTSMLLEGLS